VTIVDIRVDDTEPKNWFDLVSTSDKHSETPCDANGRVKINGCNIVCDLNCNTI